MRFQTEYRYTDRETKARYVWEKYRSLLRGEILDVGADERYLSEYVNGEASYWGIGLGGSPDQVVDLEKEAIPFADGSFDCVLCLDVLEHLDNIHGVFDELCRVTRGHAIISLPNPYCVFFNMLRWGEYKPGCPVKFYGLPGERPDDRHKWFFSVEDAEKFIRYRAGKNGLRVLQLDIEAMGNEGRGLRRRLREAARNFLFAKDVNWRNLYAGSLWAVLEKEEDAGIG